MQSDARRHIDESAVKSAGVREVRRDHKYIERAVHCRNSRKCFNHGRRQDHRHSGTAMRVPDHSGPCLAQYSWKTICGFVFCHSRSRAVAPRIEIGSRTSRIPARTSRRNAGLNVSSQRSMLTPICRGGSATMSLEGRTVGARRRTESSMPGTVITGSDESTAEVDRHAVKPGSDREPTPVLPSWTGRQSCTTPVTAIQRAASYHRGRLLPAQGFDAPLHRSVGASARCVLSKPHQDGRGLSVSP